MHEELAELYYLSVFSNSVLVGHLADLFKPLANLLNKMDRSTE